MEKRKGSLKRKVKQKHLGIETERRKKKVREKQTEIGKEKPKATLKRMDFGKVKRLERG